MKIINTYVCKDGRVRAYCELDDGRKTTLSYPRILMVQSLGRPLKPYEDVHHIDGNPQNNDLNNLEIINHTTHIKKHNPKKYYDKEMICDVCGKSFIWTSDKQSTYYIDKHRKKNRIISCSRSCSAKYGRQEQLKRNF